MAQNHDGDANTERLPQTRGTEASLTAAAADSAREGAARTEEALRTIAGVLDRVASAYLASLV